jgi:Bacterial SH3 domain
MVSFVLRGFGIAVAASSVLFFVGCGGKAAPSDPPEPVAAPEAVVETEPSSPPEPAPEAPEAAETVELRESLARSQYESSRLREALSERTAEVTALEEAKATLELELKSALEELVRSQTSVRNVQSRAFAVSRIAEVRVELQSFRKRPDPALADRLDRAAGFLDHADRALADDNLGGAAYLAERANELLRQVRTIAETRTGEPTELIPLVPPRTLEVLATANLRKGPSADSEKLGAVGPGTELKAIARRGEWFQVEIEGKTPVWVYRRLVR